MKGIKLVLCVVIMMMHLSPTIAQRRERVAFFNVENLFDTINDPATDDEQMLPLSDLEWDSAKYRRKVESIAKLILEMQCPAIMGFAEIENRSVLEDLVQCGALEGVDYDICHFDSPDKRGIDVALIYRKECFKLTDARPIQTKIDSRTRDILLVSGVLHDSPLSIIAVHWPSRIGGEKFTEPQRLACALQTKELVDALMRHNNRQGIIIMGDMNDNPYNKSLRQILGAESKQSKVQSNDTELNRLYNPFAQLYKRGKGTTVYRSRWNMYDNIIISENIQLATDNNAPHKGQKRHGYILRHDSLVDHKERPRPTYKGSDYEGGVSDHLPIYIVLEL